jgi:chemotaxis protein MotB
MRLKKEGISVIVIEHEGILRLPEEILFDKSSWELKKSGASSAVKALAKALDSVLPCYTLGPRSREDKCPKTKSKIEAIFIEGHADSDAFHPKPAPLLPTEGGQQSNPVSQSPFPIFGEPVSQPEHRGASRGAGVRTLFPPKDNLDLSALRATTTYRELLNAKQELNKYLNPENNPVLSVSGYGEYRPLAQEGGEGPESYKQRNRRIDIRILMATPKAAEAKQMQQDIDRSATNQ